MFASFSLARPGGQFRDECSKRACDSCRRLRIKCRNSSSVASLRQRPAQPCDPCRRASLKCTYLDQPARRGRPRKPRDARQTECTFSRGSSPLDTPQSHAQDGVVMHTDGSAATAESEPDEVHLSRILEDSAPAAPQQGRVLAAKPAATPSGPSEVEATASGANVASEQDLFDYANDGATQEAPPQTSNMWPQNDIWSTIDEFFDTMYIVFPVVSYIDIASRLALEPNWATALPDLRTLLYSMGLLNASARYRMHSQNQEELRGLICQVESSRLSYDFAEPATLDAVVCSLCLFAAYNVLEKHGRALLYLNEATALYEAVVPSCGAEEERKTRMQQVLFNTECATLAIYASKNARRRIEKPKLSSVNCQLEHNGYGSEVGTNQVAMHLLHCLTWIHLAEEADDVTRISLGSEHVMESLFGTAILKQHRYSRIQSADVMVTRQWQLSRKLVASCRSEAAIRALPSSMVYSLGVVAMSWICLLREGEVRVVGLGKLAGLAQNIFKLANDARYQDVVRGLTGAILREDHEGKFALPLTDVILSVAYTVPPLIDLPGSAAFSNRTSTADSGGSLGLEAVSTTGTQAGTQSGLALQTQQQAQRADAERVSGAHEGDTLELLEACYSDLAAWF